MRRHFVMLAPVLLGGFCVWLFAKVDDLKPFGSPGLSSGRAHLIAALKGAQPADARLLGFLRKRNPTTNWPNLRAVGPAAREIKDRATHQPSPEAFADLAIVELLSGRNQVAIGLLKKAEEEKPGSHLILNDLSAAYLISGTREDRPFDLLLALSMADRAVHLDHESPESTFNRALALDTLHLREEAFRAWSRYLELDPCSQWSEDARKRVASLSVATEMESWKKSQSELKAAGLSGDQQIARKIVEKSSQPARLYAEEFLLPEWAEEFSAGKYSEAKATLKSVRLIGRAVSDFNGDYMISDAVSAIDGAKNDPIKLKALTTGHLTFRMGNEARLRYDTLNASRLFRQSSKALATGHSPFRSWSDLYGVVCKLDGTDYTSVVGSLHRLRARLNQSRYPSLDARIGWILGMAWFRQSKPSLALDSLRSSLAIYERTGSSEDAGAIHYLIAEPLRYLGDREQGWRHLYRALVASYKTLNPWRVFSVYDEVANAAESGGEPEVALYFRNSVVRLEKKAGDDEGLEHAYLRRAETYGRLGNSKLAIEDFERAETYASWITDSDLRERSLAAVSAGKGELLASHDPKVALEELDRALAFFRKINQFELPRLYLARFAALQASGKFDQSFAELEEGAAEYERVRPQIVDQELQISYYDQARDLFDKLIDLSDLRGDSELALQFSERARARSLLDRYGFARTKDAASKPFTGLLSCLPPGLVVIEYSVLSERSIAWLIKANGFAKVRLPLSIRQVKHLVKRVRDHISQGQEAGFSSASAALVEAYDALIEPLLQYIKPGDVLVIVPDKDLQVLPFSALRDKRTNRYLIQNFPIVISPSIAYFCKSVTLGRRSINEKLPTLIGLGATEIDHVTFPSMPTLDHVASELSLIGELYPKAKLLMGKNVNRSVFLQEYGRYDVVHLVAHTRVDAESPLRSLFILSPEPGDKGGVLFARELYGHRCSRTKLVVLAACETGVSQSHISEGLLSLAHPFLANGVPAVVASLWSAEDSRTAGLLVRFHEMVRRGESVAKALQLAQVSLLEERSGNTREDAPRIWAGFEVFGGIDATESGLIAEKPYSRDDKMHLFDQSPKLN